MLVTDRNFLTTGSTCSLTAVSSDKQITVADGTLYDRDEILLIDAERVRVVDTTATYIVVDRAVQGSALAAHVTATIYWQHLYTIRRAWAGTTAAIHADGTAVTRWVPPAMATDMNVAYAMSTLLQHSSGWARMAGEGEYAREFSAKGIGRLEKDIQNSSLCRRMRHSAV
jgi:hypothetical protein